MSRIRAQPTLLAALACALQEAGAYNRQDEEAPAAVLWPDKERQWEALIPALLDELPLFILGDFDPEQRSGPGYWLRCLVDRKIEHPALPAGQTPIIYLPGYSQQDLRSVSDCSPTLAPLVELQFRGALWKQRKSGRDWTVLTFLQNMDDGLGIEVGADNAAKEALDNALTRLATEPLHALRHAAPLRSGYLNGLLNPDEAKRILQWLNDPEGMREAMSTKEWEAFAATCRERYGFDPEKDTVITAASLMGQRGGAWANIWARFAESPQSYRAIPDALRRARPPVLLPLIDQADSWPQDAEAAEVELRKALLELARLSPQDARKRVGELEAQHGERRSTVWAPYGMVPLAISLEHLAEAAALTEHLLGGATIEEVVAAYADGGWKADLATLRALAAVASADDLAAVRTALAAVYTPWLDAAARTMQGAVARATGAGYRAIEPPAAKAGTCILFSDGLRFDVAHALSDELTERGAEHELSYGLAALPTVTGTAKASISPAAPGFLSAAQGLDPLSGVSGPAVTAPVLRKALEGLGFEILQGDALGDPTGRTWTELGHLDAYGHQQGLALARRVPEELRVLRERIEALLAHGWREVIVVTDHGWLLVPGGLPKSELPVHLTEVRKGRCARLKEGAVVEQQTVPWRWNPNVRIAVAPGIHCFEDGKEYEHGGISPQECVVPILRVRAALAARPEITIEAPRWVGLRCHVLVSGAEGGFRVDLRLRAGDPTTSILGDPETPGSREAKTLALDGTASLLVGDADRMGDPALLVVLRSDGGVAQQLPIVVGGG